MTDPTTDTPTTDETIPVPQMTDEPAAEPPEPPDDPNQNPDDPDVQALNKVADEIAKETGDDAEGDGKTTGAQGDAPSTDGDAPQPSLAATEQVTQPEAPAAGQPAAATEGEKTPTVPLARFQEVNHQAGQLALENARLKGQNEALASMRVPAGEGAVPAAAPVEETPEQKVATVRAQQSQLAAQWDKGEISITEYEAGRQQLDDQVYDIRQAAIVPPTPAQPGEPRTYTDPYTDEKLTALEAAHPYHALIKSPTHWDFLASESVTSLKRDGTLTEFDPNNPRHELMARERMAELTDIYGPLWTGKSPADLTGGTAAAAAAGRDDQQPQPGGDQPQPSAQARARANKLALAADMPPNIAEAGAAGQDDVWTEERAAALTEEEFEALPDAARLALSRRYGDHPT